MRTEIGTRGVSMEIRKNIFSMRSPAHLIAHLQWMSLSGEVQILGTAGVRSVKKKAHAEGRALIGLNKSGLN